VFFALSVDPPFGEWLKKFPTDSPLLAGLQPPPPGLLFCMSDTELDAYAAQFRRGGFFGPLCWYRNWDASEAQTCAYADLRIRQSLGFLCGDKEIVLLMFDNGIVCQREVSDDVAMERILAGAGNWMQQERPAEVTAAIIEFLDAIRAQI
jgi:hypothetical protein